MTQTKKQIKDAIKKQTPKDYGTVTFEEYYGTEQVNDIRNKLEALFKNKKGGFVIFGNLETGKVSDAYMAICKHDVMKLITDIVDDADKYGLLAQCTCKKKQ